MRPTYEEVSQYLTYNPETGILTWTDRAAGKVKGKTAGGPNTAGYIDLKCNGKRMYGHRVAWLLTHKEWPAKHIDHINGDKADNRIENLRVVSNLCNHRNMKQHERNTSGVTGVYFNKNSKKWQAYITIEYKTKHLGLFKYLVDAETARKEAEVKYGFHENHGRLTRVKH
jgi:hypothetical protein